MKLNATQQTLKDNGYVIFREFMEPTNVLANLKEVEQMYSETSVQNKLFRERETHESRKGDACMVSIDNPSTAPYLNISKFEDLSVLFKTYTSIVGDALQENMEHGTKLLMNWQEYYEGGDNALPHHMDVELFKGDWGKYEIDIEEGLLPRYVMVLVTENQNDGGGLKAQVGETEVDLNLNAGDLLVFNNTVLLHGVPESTPKKRTMIGFRSFETKPLHFSKDYFENSVPFKNGFVEGFTKELSTDEAREELLTYSWYKK